MTFFRRERQLTALIRSADPVAAKPAHKPRYTPLWALCALLLVVWCRLPAPSGHLPAAETATLIPRSLAGSLGIHPPGGTTADPLRLIARSSLRRGTEQENSLSNPLPATKEQKGKRVGSEERARRGDGQPRRGDGAGSWQTAKRRAKPLRKRTRRAPALLVASKPHAPEPQGGMIVIAVRPMTPEELHQELNTP